MTINKKRLLKYFIDLVKIPSPSWKEERVIEYITRTMNKLGVTVKKFKCGESHNLLIRLKGDSTKVPVMFGAHMDTVAPCENIKPVITEKRISSDGTTILGSDNKAAIAAYLETISIITENKSSHGPIEFLFTCAEETGLHGIKGFDLSLLKAKYAFIFDSEDKTGKIVVRAPYQINMDISIKGKAAHAGLEPEKGISAIRIAAEIISAIPHGRIDSETTTNVGLISGGKAVNIVAEDASISLEARSLEQEKLISIIGQIENIIRNIVGSYKAKVNINKKQEYSGYSIHQDDMIIRLLSEAMMKINISPIYEASGGGSDTNIINKAGIKAVNLSIGMKKIHTKKEYIDIKDLINGTKLILSIIDTAASA